MRTNNCHVSHVSSDERVHWDVLEQEELRLASRHASREADSPVVVTRHPALVEYLTELGVVPAGAFPDVRVPLAMLASSLIPDMSDDDDDDDRCGHA